MQAKVLSGWWGFGWWGWGWLVINTYFKIWMINDDIAYKDETYYCYLIIIIISHIIIIITIIIIIIVIIIISRDRVTSWKSTPVGYTNRQSAHPCTVAGFWTPGRWWFRGPPRQQRWRRCSPRNSCPASALTTGRCRPTWRHLVVPWRLPRTRHRFSPIPGLGDEKILLPTALSWHVSPDVSSNCWIE